MKENPSRSKYWSMIISTNDMKLENTNNVTCGVRNISRQSRSVIYV